MPEIIFPTSSAPGKDAIEGGGRLINVYAERLQGGAPTQFVRRRAPGLTLFSETSQAGYRGAWFDDESNHYVAFSSKLYKINSAGSETEVGTIPDGAIAYSGQFSSTANNSSYTLTSVPFGLAHADRRIVVGTIAMEYEGSTIVTNGTFGSDIASWATSNITWNSGSGNGYAAADVGLVGEMAQALTTVASAVYRIRITPRASGSARSITVYWNGTPVINFSSAAGVEQIVDVVAAGTSVGLLISIGSGTGAAGVDSISVTRVQFALPTAVTIGGVSATDAASPNEAALWIANVPTGTSGSVVLTYANTMNEAYVEVWRLNGVTSSTPIDTAETSSTPGFADLTMTAGSVAIFMARRAGPVTWTRVGVSTDKSQIINLLRYSAMSGYFPAAGTASITSNGPQAIIAAAAWQADVDEAGDGAVTFAKNTAIPPDQLLCASGAGLVSFTSSTVGAAIDVNDEIPTSVTYGEGFFFVTTVGGRCYASGVNNTTFNSLDSIRAEQKPEPLIRGLFFDGELYLFGATHTEIWASRGNPNSSGFPLNYTATIWRGLVSVHAVCGFERGFHPVLIWVADDNPGRMANGYTPQQISTPDVERAIQACTTKSRIRCAVYAVDGHACATIDIDGEATWVYDLNTELWHERDTNDSGSWIALGNSVKAFDKWLVGRRESGNIYEIDADAMTDGGEAVPAIVESAAMTGFPQSLQVARADFNFVSGVGTASVPDPTVDISWSDDGGHTWSDPVARKIGENGRWKTQVRVNRVGKTSAKGRRWRVRVDDQVRFGLLGGNMDVAGLK